jgi:hypothetical protein
LQVKQAAAAPDFDPTSPASPAAMWFSAPEMKSTGESMGIDQDFATAYLKAQLGAGTRLPRSGNVLLSVRDADKPGSWTWLGALRISAFVS